MEKLVVVLGWFLTALDANFAFFLNESIVLSNLSNKLLDLCSL